MKLVAAKCPNCGSNIDVNPNQETMKCEYCRSAILIDDAISKYKIEVSGEIEIKNLPKIDNYLKLAERSYKNKDYDDAYEKYGKILELDLNNPIALIRYGICKTLLNNYIDFSMEYLINSFKDTIKIIENDKKYNIDDIVSETVYANDESLYALRKYYNSYTVNGDDLANIQKKLMSILMCYETVIDYTDNKTHIIVQIIAVLKDLIRDKNYKTGSSIHGGNFLETYKLEHGDKQKLIKKLNMYEKMLNPEFKEIIENTIETNILPNNKNKIKGSVIVMDIFLWIMILGLFLSYQFISLIIMLFIFFIITYEDISYKYFENDKKKKKRVIIILIIILIFTIEMGI